MQDDLGRGGVEHGLAFAPVPEAGVGKFDLGSDRAQAFVRGEDGQAEAAVELVGKALAARGQRMCAAVEVSWNANHQRDRPPFGDESGDGLEAGVVRFVVQRGKGAGLPGLEFAGGDADAGETEVEAEQRAASGQRRTRGCGFVTCRRGASRIRHARRPR